MSIAKRQAPRRTAAPSHSRTRLATARPTALAAALLAALALGGCEPAWDGPGLLAQAGQDAGGPPAGADVWVGGDAIAPPVDTGGPSDLAGTPDAGPADVAQPPIDVADAADAGADTTPDVDVAPDTGPDVPPGPDGGGTVCPPPGEGTVNPVLTFGLSPHANADGALDLDHDVSTCAPSIDCEDGADNAMASIAELFAPQLTDALLSLLPDVLPAVQLLTDDVRAGTFAVALWPAEEVSGAGCPEDALQCEVILYAESDDGSCGPAWVLDEGRLVDGDTVVAGRPESEHVLELTLDDAVLEVSVYALQLRARVELDGDGRVVRMDGTLGGAIERIDFLDVLQMAEEELGEWYPLLEDIVEGFLDTDFDTDGDGRGDAASFAITFTARDGQASAIESDGLPIWMGQQ